MKVHYSKNLRGYSGTDDGAVYYYHPRLKVSLVRDYVVPKNDRNTNRTRIIMANLKLIQPSNGYKRNFRDYLAFYNNLKENRHTPMLSWYNLYIKLLFALQESNPEVNLTTLSREQIYLQNLPCRSLKTAIEAGLLPVVDDYQRFDQLI